MDLNNLAVENKKLKESLSYEKRKFDAFMAVYEDILLLMEEVVREEMLLNFEEGIKYEKKH